MKCEKQNHSKFKSTRISIVGFPCGIHYGFNSAIIEIINATIAIQLLSK